jgi:hypothetical protein
MEEVAVVDIRILLYNLIYNLFECSPLFGKLTLNTQDNGDLLVQARRLLRKALKMAIRRTS